MSKLTLCDLCGKECSGDTPYKQQEIDDISVAISYNATKRSLYPDNPEVDDRLKAPVITAIDICFDCVKQIMFNGGL